MVSEMIPMTNLAAQFQVLEGPISAAIQRVLRSGWYILGTEVVAFEREFAAFCGAGDCIGVASGTDAVALALKSCGVQPGDEVITVSHTAVATVAAVVQIGAVPVFADIDPLTRCIDPGQIVGLISKKTSAVVPVHIYGQPAPMTEIMRIADEYGLKVVEDCAQAHGATIEGKRVGTFGHAAAFSFYPTKNLGAIGDGGAVVTSDQDCANKCRWLREYGWKERYTSHIQGFNSRLDELQAAILRVKLPYLEGDNARRRECAARYNEALYGTNVIAPHTISGSLHAMHLYVVECDARQELRDYLGQKGIMTAVHYPLAVHEQPAYRNLYRGCGNLTRTEQLYRKIISLPLYPELNNDQIDYICGALASWKEYRP
jgi:dTDP-4-amino-4,6-dideoxygalactose transaminase